jgi:hypothetical protein
MKIPARSFLPRNPDHAWFFLVFLPAACYLIVTRLILFQHGPSRSDSLEWPSGTLVFMEPLQHPRLDQVLLLGNVLKLPVSSNTGQTLREQAVLDRGGWQLVDGMTNQEVKSAVLLLGAPPSSFSSLVDAVWRHDSELGRGYLLMSDATVCSRNDSSGRVWRWEVGGGPLTIGRTLHLDQAGCRSPTPVHGASCCSNSREMGSGGLAIDFHHGAATGSSNIQEGLLTVAEYGEGRIIRLEANGARTPLVISVPTAVMSNSTESRRLEQATKLLYTPFGDLFFIERYEAANCREDLHGGPTDTCSIHESLGAMQERRQMYQLYRLPYATSIPALPSLHVSRRAHAWESVLASATVEGLESGEQESNLSPFQKFPYQLPQPVSLFDPNDAHRNVALGDLALAPDWTNLYLTAVVQPWLDINTTVSNDTMDGMASIVLMRYRLPTEEMDDDEEEIRTESIPRTAEVVYALSSEDVGMSDFAGLLASGPGFLAVGKSGVVYWAIGGIVLLIDFGNDHNHDTGTSKGKKQTATLLGRMPLPGLSGIGDAAVTSIALGGDGYLYVTSHRALLRLRVRDRPAGFPTNMVIKPPNGPHKQKD